MDPPVYDTLILSDLHLGSELSRARDATQLLRQMHFRRLILLGDIFSDLNFRRLTKQHWKFLSCIRKLSNPKRQVEVVWVEGNHDRGLVDIMSHLVGVRVYQEYIWQYDGRRHLAIHGHQFDRFVLNNALLSAFNSFLHLQIQRFDFTGKWFSRFVDRMGTRWLRLSSKVSTGALAHARTKQADRIFCGHTHEAMSLVQDGVAYYNSGNWADKNATYITVGPEGVQIHEYVAHEQSDEMDASQDGPATKFAEDLQSGDAEFEEVL